MLSNGDYILVSDKTNEDSWHIGRFSRDIDAGTVEYYNLHCELKCAHPSLIKKLKTRTYLGSKLIAEEQ